MKALFWRQILILHRGTDPIFVYFTIAHLAVIFGGFGDAIKQAAEGSGHVPNAPFTLLRFFFLIRVCCIDATRSHYFVFVQKRREKHSFLSVHIDSPDNKYEAKDKISVFVPSHCSGFVKLIVEY